MGSKKSSNKGLVIYVLVLVVAMIVIVALMRQATKTVSEYSYSEIMGYFDNYQVSEYNFDLGTGELDMVVTNEDGTTKKIEYVVPNVTVFLNEIQTGDENYRREYNKLHEDAPLKVEYYKIQDTSWLYNLLPSLLIIVLMVVLFMFMMRQAGGGGKITSFSKANVKNTSNKKNTFADVAGADEEKGELAEIVDFLKNPKKYTDIGARIPKGVLLMGPPGTGKTLLAKAVAGEAGVPFFSISGSDFVELYVGVGASRVRDLFETAKKNAPAIIFIDEIDAVGRHRGAGLGGGHDEREQTLNQLLVEMDGFDGNEGVIVIAATNRRDILDPALLRPGRFDRQITVSYPDIKGREEILKVHTRKKPLGPDVDLSTIAKTTAGFTGADLENILNEAAINAAKSKRKFITNADVNYAFVKVGIGVEKRSKIISEKEKKITAYHESGHAILFHVLPDVGPVHTISIIPTGMGAAGYTMPLPEKDEMFNTKGKMLQNIIVSLGGRVAEELIFDDITTGASQDIKQATATARDMVTKYGFSDRLGLINYASSDEDEVFIGRDLAHTRPYGEDIATAIDEEVKNIIDDCYAQAKKIISEHMDVLEKSSELLLEKEKVTREEFEALFDNGSGTDDDGIMGTTIV